MTLVLIVMGVTGAGKSTIAERLSETLGWAFQEGDLLHPPANIQKMHAGHPLDDEDRKPWLAAVRAWIDKQLAAGTNGLITCSALRRTYRDYLIAGRPDVRLLYLEARPAVLEARVEHRTGHFMPPTLLDSQLQTLERPGPDEHPIVINVEGTEEEAEAAALRAIREIAPPT